MGAVDEQLAKLHSVVEGLEARIKRLEERKFGDSTLSSQDVRMILIGPPGAGTHPLPHVSFGSDGQPAHLDHRQGHAGPQDQGEVQLLSPGKPIGASTPSSDLG